MTYLQFYKKVSFDNPIILFLHSAKKSYANCFINLRQNTKTPLPVESNSKFQDSNLPGKIFMFTKLFSLILIKSHFENSSFEKHVWRNVCFSSKLAFKVYLHCNFCIRFLFYPNMKKIFKLLFYIFFDLGRTEFLNSTINIKICDTHIKYVVILYTW